MTHIAGFEHAQLILLPEAVDDCVEGHNPVRFIVFVDGLDLAAPPSRGYDARATGWPCYAPGEILKLRSVAI
jgi:hypothetical protein